MTPTEERQWQTGVSSFKSIKTVKTGALVLEEGLRELGWFSLEKGWL